MQRASSIWMLRSRLIDCDNIMSYVELYTYIASLSDAFAFYRYCQPFLREIFVTCCDNAEKKDILRKLSTAKDKDENKIMSDATYLEYACFLDTSTSLSQASASSVDTILLERSGSTGTTQEFEPLSPRLRLFGESAEVLREAPTSDEDAASDLLRFRSAGAG